MFCTLGLLNHYYVDAKSKRIKYFILKTGALVSVSSKYEIHVPLQYVKRCLSQKSNNSDTFIHKNVVKNKILRNPIDISIQSKMIRKF